MAEKGPGETYDLFLLVVAVTTTQLNRIIVQFLLYEIQPTLQPFLVFVEVLI